MSFLLQNQPLKLVKLTN